MLYSLSASAGFQDLPLTIDEELNSFSLKGGNVKEIKDPSTFLVKDWPKKEDYLIKEVIVLFPLPSRDCILAYLSYSLLLRGCWFFSGRKCG